MTRTMRNAKAVPDAVAPTKSQGLAICSMATMTATAAVPMAPESYCTVLHTALPSAFISFESTDRL